MATTRILEELAGSRHGVISRELALVHGVPREQFDWRVRNGSLARLYCGVYRFIAAPMTWHQRALGLTMLGGQGALLSHESAAFLHELEDYGEPRVLDLSLPRCRRMREPDETRVHRTREFLEGTVIEGLPATTLARTLVDLSKDLPAWKLERVLHAAWRLNLGIAGQVEASLGALQRSDWRGADLLLELVQRLQKGGFDSTLEVRFRQRMAQAAIPEPELRHVVRDERGAYVMRLDFAWKKLKVAMHVDGFAFHHDPAAMLRDAEQRARLTALDWKQLVVMAQSLRNDDWLRRLEQTLSLQRLAHEA